MSLDFLGACREQPGKPSLGTGEGAGCIFGVPIPAHSTFGVPRPPPINAWCLSFPPERCSGQGRAVSSRELFGAGSRGLLHYSSWHLGAVGSSQDLALPIFHVLRRRSLRSLSGCGHQGRAGVWEFLFIQAPFPGHPTAPQGEIPGCQHLGKALLLPDRMPGMAGARAELTELPLPILPFPPSLAAPPGWEFHQPDRELLSPGSALSFLSYKV